MSHVRHKTLLSTQLHGLRHRLWGAWAWLLYVAPADPVRQALNRAMAPIYPIFAAVTLMLAPIYPGALDRALMALVAASFLLAQHLNRRGSAWGPGTVVIVILIAVPVVVPPSEFLTSRGNIYLPSDLFLPLAIAVLFVGARAGVLTCLALVVMIPLRALAAGFPWPVVERYLIYSSPTLVALTALLIAGAAQFHHALRRSARANAELELRVAERTRALADANDQLASANDQLAEAKALAERRAELRLKEVTEVVHDARNQIGHIRAAAELITEDPLVAAQISDSARRSQRIINDSLAAQQDLLDAMLEAAMLEAGALVLQRDVVDLVEVVAREVEQARPRYERHRCALELAPSPPLPVRCDRRRIARVVRNLLHNALTYTAAYRSSCGLVRVGVARDGDEAVIQVVDNGLGIDPEQLARLGQRFVRAGDAGVEGSGIGLNASIGIVALHGGSLRLTSPGAGRGATAEVRLPVDGSGG